MTVYFPTVRTGKMKQKVLLRLAARRKSMAEIHPKSTVFVLEDDPGVRDSLTALLEAVGIRTRTFVCGTDIVRSAPILVDGCLLLDICLPDFDGFEVLRRLRDANVQLPAIFMTGQEFQAQSAQAPRLGAVAVLRKPISDTLLLSAISTALVSAKAQTA
jgi:two-component system response regulator FixJ